jgi:hypothetical protein
MCAAGDLLSSFATAVGHKSSSDTDDGLGPRLGADEEEALPDVGEAEFRRREKSCFNIVAHFLKIARDLTESDVNVIGHVLEEGELGVALLDEVPDGGPEVTGVLLPLDFPGAGEGLARVASSDAIHDSTPRTAVEGS